MLKKIILIFFIAVIPNIAFWDVVEISCSSSDHFSSSCNQCFVENTNIYLWYWPENLSDTRNAWNAWTYIYYDENLTPVSIHPFYTNWELTQWPWWFHWASNLNDWDWNNWENYLDTQGFLFIKILPNTSWKILQSDDGYYINFSTLSEAIVNNWRDYPLWETQYIVNYYNIWDRTQRTHKECVLNYPAWCWDWILDTTYWETCDFNDPSKTWWWVWGCDDTCEPIGTSESCDSLTASPSSARDSLTSNLECSWTNAVSYLIEVKDSSGNVIKTINANSWSVTLNTRWSYTAQCYVNGSITSTACTKPLSVTGWWWGGGGPDCIDFEFWVWTWNVDEVVSPYVSPNTLRNITFKWNALEIPVICQWDWDSNYAYVDCWNGSITWIKSLNGSKKATFICEYLGSSTSLFRPKCYVWENSSRVNESSLLCTWKIAFSGWWWGSNYCWDWVVQRPNDNWEMEECDFGSENGKPGVLCDANCKLSSYVITIPWVADWVITIPDNWEIILWVNSDIIVWDDINIYEKLWQLPYITNMSAFEIAFEKLCVYLKDWNSLDGSSSQCITAWRLDSGETLKFSSFPSFISNTDSIIWSFEDNVLVTTINNLVNAYFTAKVNVRVVKPSITTLGWWTSFVEDSSDIADINEVMEDDDNSNFVWVWITDNLSSDIKNIDDEDVKDNASGEMDTNNDTINSNINVESVWTSIPTTSNISDFESFNWMDNVFILKNKNFQVTSSTDFWAWAKTYIIENANLMITSNIEYWENIAFVVKGWNIKISDNVTNINWIYISIIKDWVGWEISWYNKTDKVLNVNWALYWDITNLVNKRIYIEEEAWYLNVWTIVSFGSSVFRQPAPLTWQFIWEYLDSEKVAK